MSLTGLNGEHIGSDKFRVPEKYRITTPIGQVGVTTKEAGNNGAFKFKIDSNTLVCCIASDGFDWEHVSVQVLNGNNKTRIPSWDIMCKVKSLFWGSESRVLQYHPPKSEYVNNHPHVLHLWRPTDKKMPFPPSVMVGI